METMMTFWAHTRGGPEVLVYESAPRPSLGGDEVLVAVLAALHRGGHLITLQEPPSQELADRYGVTALFFIVAADQDCLIQLADIIDTGRLKANVAATFPGRGPCRVRERHRPQTPPRQDRPRRPRLTGR
jgi:hypothetical protein